MTHTARSARLAAATALTLPLLLAGCSDGGDGQASSSAADATSTSTAADSSSTTSTSTSTSTRATGSGSGSSTTSGASSTTSSGASSSSASSGASSSTTKKLDPKLVTSCVSATTKINGATGQWNVAVRSGKSSLRDSAARRLGSTAKELRTLASGSKHKGFSSRTRTVASELDKMQKAYDGKKSVRSGDLNSSSRALRTWCTDQIKP